MRFFGKLGLFTTIVGRVFTESFGDPESWVSVFLGVKECYGLVDLVELIGVINVEGSFNLFLSNP